MNMSKGNNPQPSFSALVAPFVVGLYAWLAAISFGLVWLDIFYARQVPQGSVVAAETADFLLFVYALTLLAALGAVILSWPAKSARIFILAGLVISVAGLFAPLFLSPFLGEGSSLGAGIRMLIAAAVSILAFIGFYKLTARNYNSTLHRQS